MRKLTIEKGKKYGLSSEEEVLAYNEWEYRRAEGGRTPFPSQLSEAELQANLQAIKDFTTNQQELEKKFYKIQSAIASRENLWFSNFILILAIISIMLFFMGYIPFIIPLFLGLGYFYTR